MSQRNGSSNGNGKVKKPIIFFTLADLRKEAKERGFRLVPYDTETLPHCGYLECLQDIRRDDEQLYLVRGADPESRTARHDFLWHTNHMDPAQEPSLTRVVIQPNDFLFRVARAAGYRLEKIRHHRQNGAIEIPQRPIRRNKHKPRARHSRELAACNR